MRQIHSSKSYVIAIREDYKFSDKQKQQIMEAYNNWNRHEWQLTPENIDQELQSALYKLCHNDEVWDQRYTSFLKAIMIVLEEEIVIARVDTVQEWVSYINVLSVQNKEKFLKVKALKEIIQV